MRATNEAGIATPPESISRPAARWARLAPWGLVLILLAGEFVLFRRHALNEVVWSYPGIYDQAVYLQRSYETYDATLRTGFWNGLKYGAGFDGGDTMANGALMHLEAAILFHVLG